MASAFSQRSTKHSSSITPSISWSISSLPAAESHRDRAAHPWSVGRLRAVVGGLACRCPGAASGPSRQRDLSTCALAPDSPTSSDLRFTDRLCPRVLAGACIAPLQN